MKAYIFAGQGSQSRGMGRELFAEFPEYVARANDILGYSIEELCLSDGDGRLDNTEYTQPAIYVVNALSYMKKVRDGSGPADYCAGHSLGEYNALLAAGAFSFEDGLRLVKKRGALMGASKGGGMAAVVGFGENDIRELFIKNDIVNIDVANFNSPSQFAIAGPKTEIEAAKKVFEEAGAVYHILRVGGAFHSRYMQEAKTEFGRLVETFQFARLKIPVVSNLRALPYANGRIAAGLTQQITGVVRWSESVRYMALRGVTEWVEVAARPVLTPLLKRILK
ncbi:ACP S-malonyltransferase [Sorangium atrum]|uniref:Malonyl CoA-acyl carrier protein transacylase n=2 Tax=Sorangium TaxID=39643 RepID=A0A1S6R508_SORCE|nr:ACP S-malonyltransferase [Sorangium aterium]AQW44884.1 Trans-acting acyltransferase [Sorangium cellulosum]MDC0681368.1 ACP S-malonyltransferase [Sorangium aterium]